MRPQLVAGRSPERHRCCAEQIGGAPPFQRRAVLLLAEEHHHGAEQRGDHGGNQIERDAIERHHVGPLLDIAVTRSAHPICAPFRMRRYVSRVPFRFSCGRKFSGNTSSICIQTNNKKGAEISALLHLIEAAFAANATEAINASRTGRTGGPWPCRTSCARPRGSRG